MHTGCWDYNGEITMSMTFEIEKNNPLEIEKFSHIEKKLKYLRSYGPKSFAILSKEDGSYIQVAGGGVTCVVEIRDANKNIQERAYLLQSRVPFSGEQTLVFGGGKIIMEPNEILFIEDVIEVFKSFFYKKPFPKNIYWKKIRF